MFRKEYLKTVSYVLLISTFLFLPHGVSLTHADVNGYGTGLKKVLNENYDQAYSLFFEVCIEEKFEIKVILKDDDGEELTIRFITGDKSNSYSASDDLIKYYIDLKIDDPETGYYNDYTINSTNALDSLEEIVRQETLDRTFSPGDPDAKIKSLTLLGDLYFLRVVGFGNTGNNDILWKDDFSEYDNSGYNVGYLDLIEKWENLTYPVSGFSIGDDDGEPILVAVAPPSTRSSYGYYSGVYGYPFMGYGYPPGYSSPYNGFGYGYPLGGVGDYWQPQYTQPPNFSNWIWTSPTTAYNPYTPPGQTQMVFVNPVQGWQSPYFQQTGYNPYIFNQPYNYGFGSGIGLGYPVYGFVPYPYGYGSAPYPYY
ncbi:MAG: hypothetical protein ACMUIU_16930 [bacterium]